MRGDIGFSDIEISARRVDAERAQAFAHQERIE
jgi:hypothetical protein